MKPINITVIEEARCNYCKLDEFTDEQINAIHGYFMENSVKAVLFDCVICGDSIFSANPKDKLRPFCNCGKRMKISKDDKSFEPNLL